MTAPDDATPLGEVRDWLRTQADAGTTCPCCTQFVKVYKRSLPSASARVMLALWRNNGGHSFVYLPDLLDTLKGTAHQGGYGTLSQHWGLIESRPGIRDDGSTRVGWWKLTELGVRFVTERATVPRYADIYNGRCLRRHGPPWSIRQALGTRFNYDELMGR